MPNELSVGRISSIAKTVTNLNVSKDFKHYLKKKAEIKIKNITRLMEDNTLAESPEAKTIADTHPHLSSNRVKNLMMLHSEKRIGASAVTRAVEEAEKEIRKLVKIGEKKALENNAKTLMERFMVDEEELSCKSEYVDDVNLRRLIGCYTDKNVRAEAVSELRVFLEEEMEELTMGLQKIIGEGKETEYIIEMLKNIGRIIDQARIKTIITGAEKRANERGKDSITVEEIIDSF